MTLRALVVLLLGGATLFAAANVGVGWLYLMAFLFVSYGALAYGLAALTLRGLRVEVRAAKRASAGAPLEVVVVLSHTGRTAKRYLSLLGPPVGTRRLLGVLRGSLRPEGWAHALVLELLPGERSLVSLELQTSTRGLHPIPPLVVQVPAHGLGAVHRRLETRLEVLVRPEVRELPVLPWLSGARGDREDGFRGFSEAEGDLIRTLRPYRPGDPMRMIHWRSTARAGVPRTKEMEAEGRQGALDLVLDLGPESLEHGLSVAASLCAYAERTGLRLRLVRGPAEPALEDLEAQLDWLAGLRGSRVQTRREAPAGGACLSLTGHSVLPSDGGIILHVGEGPAPRGAIACPPGPDWPRALGGPHGP